MSDQYTEKEMIVLVEIWLKECVGYNAERTFEEFLEEATSKNAKYWKISHSPDLTETGNPMERTYIKTIWVGMSAHQHYEKELLEDFCVARFGPKVVFVQSVAPAPGWQIYPIDQIRYIKAVPIFWGGIRTTTTILVIYLGEKGRPIKLMSEKLIK
jgi:hypothetical protein